VRKGCVVDVQALPAKARAGLTAIRRKKGGLRPSQAARDTFFYRLTIKGPGGEKTIHLNESTIPSPARGLIAFLSSRSSPVA
jgi:hypothetical protein